MQISTSNIVETIGLCFGTGEGDHFFRNYSNTLRTYPQRIAVALNANGGLTLLVNKSSVYVRCPC